MSGIRVDAAKFWADFQANQKGSVIFMFGLILGVIVAATGVAIDYGRAQMVQSKLHASLDAAGLAAGSVAKSRNVDSEVRKFMEANFPQGYMDTTYRLTRISATENPVDSSVTIDLRAEGEMNTSFMNAFAFRTVEVEASTEVIQARRRGFELVMALDNSGSMAGVQGGVTRTAAMVVAANDMLDMLYGTSDFYNNLFIGLVPFSNYVRVGDAKVDESNWLRADSSSTVAIAGDVNCLRDTDPTSPAWFEADRNLIYSVTDTPPESGDTLYLRNQVSPTASCNGVSGLPQMLAMQNTKADVKAALANMGSSGNTRVDLGAIWAWRMLSPRWRGMWNHEGPSLPLDYGSEDMDKVVILLTDGANNPHGNDGISIAATNTQLTNACTAMKQEGIIIYTIVFHEQNATIQGRMRGCATSSDHYFFAAGNDSIRDVFSKIADSLMNLRISR